MVHLAAMGEDISGGSAKQTHSHSCSGALHLKNWVGLSRRGETLKSPTLSQTSPGPSASDPAGNLFYHCFFYFFSFIKNLINYLDGFEEFSEMFQSIKDNQQEFF